jgi:hypothetical protein
MNNLSPWPDEGRTVQFMFRKATWVYAWPIYNENNVIHTLADLKRLLVAPFWFPFLTVNNRFFHFYIGWKPLNMEDPGFFWRDLNCIKKNILHVQLSARWGFGDIS